MLIECKKDKESVLEKVKSGKIDSICMSSTNFVEDIVLSMHRQGILNCIVSTMIDKRKHNATVPYNVILAAAIVAKMKVQTSLTDIPYALTDHRLIGELGYTFYDTDRNVGKALMTESSLRFLIDKYSPEEFLSGYNDSVQKGIMKKLGLTANIHILDCTDLEVNFKNKNYENSGISHSKRMPDGTEVRARGYKLATLRGIVGDRGIIEEIQLGSLNTHDLNLSKDMILQSEMLKEGDILINDRGFLSRDVMNYLKKVRGVDTYVPLRQDMQSYAMAVSAAKMENKWRNHPSRKYKGQKICLIEDLGPYWIPKEREYDLPDCPINGCVIWNTATDNYSVIVTTDTKRTASQIIKTYMLRPEIEEDYRQLKDFWKLEDFKSTKYVFIAFHIVCSLFGYLFFQLYTLLPDGEKYAGKCLPVILKKYVPKLSGNFIIYVDNEFGIFSMIELLKLYSSSPWNIQEILEKVINQMEDLHVEP